MEHLLKMPCTSMPFVCEADYSVTLTPMIHVDRTAPSHGAGKHGDYRGWNFLQNYAGSDFFPEKWCSSLGGETF